MAVAIIDNGAFQKNLKHVDPSIVLFSSSTDMTRYDIADLKKIRDSKLSQQPPSCFYDPNIMRLNILKYKNRHPEVIEAQMKAFREKLQNISCTGWDPNILHLLRNYHNALLNPFYNGYTGNYQNQQQQMFNQQQQPTQAFNHQQPPQFPSPDRVSFMEKQQAVLDKIPSYDRKMNFFDNLTTTATIRPSRMGDHAYNFDHRHHTTFFKRPNQHQPNYLRKPNSCASEQHGNSYSSSVGYFSGNDTKSSCGEETLLEKPSEKRQCFESNKKDEPNKDEEEKEPEWFSVPATLEDFIDLHGFSDEDISEPKQVKEQSPEVKQQAVENQRNNIINNNNVSNSSNNNNNNSLHHEYQQNQNRRYNHNSSFNRYSHNNSGYSSHNSSYNQSFNSHNSSYNQNNNSYYNRNMNYRSNPVNNNANQRFRNPLHFNKPVRTAPAPQMINPFFDAWKSGKFLHQQNVSFTDLMEHNNSPKNLPSNTMYMSEVESRMKQHQSMGIANQQLPPPTAVPQFFQNLANNWGVRVNENPTNAYQYNAAPPPPLPQQQVMYDGYKMPTQEQLHQFTSEIMRNAIIRKNQQYHDENNYHK